MTEEIRPINKIEKFVEDHGKKILIAGIAFFILVGAWWWNTNKRVPKREAEAIEAIYMAQNYFASDSVDAVLNGTTDAMGTIDIADEYSGTKAAKLANFYSGRTEMKEGNFESAIDYLEDADFDDELMAPLTTCLIGDCYSELENYEEAASKYWEAATMRDNNYSSPKCYKKAALVYEKLGNFEKALKAYKTIQEEYTNSPLAKDISKYISRVEARLANS